MKICPQCQCAKEDLHCERCDGIGMIHVPYSDRAYYVNANDQTKRAAILAKRWRLDVRPLVPPAIIEADDGP